MPWKFLLKRIFVATLQGIPWDAHGINVKLIRKFYHKMLMDIAGAESPHTFSTITNKENDGRGAYLTVIEWKTKEVF